MGAPLHSLDFIRAELQARIDQLVTEFYPAATKDASGRNWQLGDLGGAKGQSLRIRRLGNRAGGFKDFASGETGGVFDLIREARGLPDIRSAIGWAQDWLGLSDTPLTAEDRRAREREASARRKADDEREAAAIARRQRAAKALWLDGSPIAGTPAERYLAGRNIAFHRLGRWPGALRFHPALPLPAGMSGTLPGMVSCVLDARGQIVAVHRTFLMCHASGRVTKADVKNGGPLADAKMTLGPMRAGYIPVWKGKHGKPMLEAVAGEWVAVTEGIEDALTVAMARPDLRVIAAYSLSNIGNLVLPDHLGGVYLCADNDAKAEAQAQLARAQERLGERHAVRVVRPPAPFKDFNDWAQALALEAAA